MFRVRPFFVKNRSTKRLLSMWRQPSKTMEYVDIAEDVEHEDRSRVNANENGGPGTSSTKPRSKILMALDAHFSDACELETNIHQPTPQQKPTSSAQQPRSVHPFRSIFNPKPIPKPDQSAAEKVATPNPDGNSIKSPSTTHAGALRGSSNSNSIKPASATSSSKTYKKSGGSTKVQVNLPLYSYRDKRFSEPSPVPKRIYVRSVEQANELVSKLDTSSALGFDLEWRVIFRSKAPPRPTAVLQICDKSMILVIQLSSMAGQFPSKLKEVLEDRNVPKLGVNILNDGIRIGNDFGFRPHALLELGGLVRQADPGPKGYLEKYFRVANPDYLEEYLASLETKDPVVSDEDDEMSSEKENGSPATPEEENLDSNDKASKGGETSSTKPRKPGAMIALATVTAMYTGRTLNKGPVRSSNWEKDPLSEAQLEYAANDAHCALVVYERLMKLARENNITLDSEKYLHDVKWYHTKKKPESTVAHKTQASKAVPRERLSMSSFTISTPAPSTATEGYLPLYADDDDPMTGPSDTLGAQGTNAGNAARSVKQRPQHIRAYNFWYVKNMTLDNMCKTLRSPDNPLKVGTVIGYVVGALQADPSLRFSYEKIKVLLESEKASFARHKLWFEALDSAGNIHVNMTREVVVLD